MNNAYERAALSGLDGAAFTRAVERLLLHLGFKNVTNIDGSGDLGGDLLAQQGSDLWVFQCKKSSSAVGLNAVDEAVAAVAAYGASRAAVVTNAEFTQSAVERASAITRLSGLDVGLWDGEVLAQLRSDTHCRERLPSLSLRPYQAEAFRALESDLRTRGSALLILATGLGKTVVAGNIIDSQLLGGLCQRVLVLAHAKELVDQLERALWSFLPLSVRTQRLSGDSKPDDLTGVTVATVQTAVKYVRLGFKPDFLWIDEAHHVGEDGDFSEILDLLPEVPRLGVTATPWRGDRFDIQQSFGAASYQLGIEEGMKLGFLADVKYKLFTDNIDWEYVSEMSGQSISLKSLNRKLFLPQRDEQIRDELLGTWSHMKNPKGIVFCQSVEHAERMLQTLQAVPIWRHCGIIHGSLPKRAQKVALMDFRRGVTPLLVAVDVLNEGVDVPDVNIVCFARVTHSRRIFVQQLGRGLRLREGKEFVTVLDFASDIRRLAAAFKMKSHVTSDSVEVFLPSQHSIEFTDARAESFMAEWMKEAASLENEVDEAVLNFPEYR